jgi:hypothetical protein
MSGLGRWILADCVAAQDTIRILVATDNHVGYAERDPVRGNDSFETFDEIMQLGKDRDVSLPTRRQGLGLHRTTCSYSRAYCPQNRSVLWTTCPCFCSRESVLTAG